MSAAPLLSTYIGFRQVVPNVAWPLDSCNSGPVTPETQARYAAKPIGFSVLMLHEPFDAQAGCTNIGIRRTTPSLSGLMSTEARVTLG